MDEKFTEKRKKKNLKNIWLSDEEVNKWDPKKIHEFLNSNGSETKELLRQLYDIMRIKMIPKFELNEEERNSIIKINEVLNYD